MALLLGKKIGMTQLYDETGQIVPVTVIQAGPCAVIQVKTAETDGYNAIQLGYDDIKPNRRNKPQLGHVAKANTTPKKFIREMQLTGETGAEYKVGDSITVSIFSEKEMVDVIGTSKGKGFAGCMKRYGFGGFPASHGTERKHRAQGSIASFASNAGMGAGIKRGKKMPGRLGGERVTAKNHSLVAVDKENNLLIVKGSVPGPAGGYCIVRSSKKALKAGE
ncbi:MAG: 50S ribosomal protein L3 [Planctomycetes bacterium RBG_13_46_10]|nr:MAG: 50S ribosomal protein L3 [Planctomycetes bacterium RBG_13_46_10]